MKHMQRKKLEAKNRYQRQKIQRGHRVPQGTQFKGLQALLQGSGTTTTTA